MFDFLKEIVPWAVQVVTAAPALATAGVGPLIAGAVIKHAASITKKIPVVKYIGKAIDKIPNGIIPLINFAAFGPLAAGSGGLTHQLLKIGTRAMFGKVSGTAADKINAKVGPGHRVSI